MCEHVVTRWGSYLKCFEFLLKVKRMCVLFVKICIHICMLFVGMHIITDVLFEYKWLDVKVITKEWGMTRQMVLKVQEAIT